MKRKNTKMKGLNTMLLEITNDILESAIKSVLSNTAQGPKAIRDLVDAKLSAEGYNTNMITSTGQDNLYIKTKARLRNWSDKGINCKDIGGAKYVSLDANSDTAVSPSPSPTPATKSAKAPKAPKTKIVVEEIPIVPTTEEELEEIEKIIVESNKQEDLEEIQVRTKTQTQTKRKDSLMENLENQKDMWIQRLKSEGALYFEQPQDLTCPSLRALAISTQSCYGKFSANDSECKISPLSKWCAESKDNKNDTSTVSTYVSNPTAEAKAKAEAEAKAEAKAKAKAEAQASKPIVSQRLNDAVSLYGKQEVDLSCDIKCVISGDQLKAGSKGYFVNNIGIVSPRCFSK